MNINQLMDLERGTLSPLIFTDLAIYKLEVARIFGKSWLFLGHESQIPNAGDFFTSYMAEDPVVVVRQKDGSIVAFLNQCRHRGMRICRTEAGNARAFMCSYHGWGYNIAGELQVVPHDKQYGSCFRKEEWGARRVTRLEIYKGLIFANWNKDASPLEKSLGSAKGYVDGLVDRLEGGSEVVGGVHKWVINCNWKMPAEQFANDIYHTPTTHISALEACRPKDYDPALHSMDREGSQFWSDEGHGGGFLYADSPNPQVWIEPAAKKWMSDTFPEARERLGKDLAARVSGFNTLFPNFSWLNGTNTIRVWHPRGPDQVEVWAWVLVDKKAPPEVKDAFRLGALRSFGPSGMLEQDDGENWVEVQKVLKGQIAGQSDFCYQMSLGGASTIDANGSHRGPLYSDNSARNFYRRWAEMLCADDEARGSADVVLRGASAQ